MAMTGTCGPHCGIRSNAEGTFNREGHCDCGTCHDGNLLPGSSGEHRTVYANLGTGTPMCAAWYERAGTYRPWHSRAEGCTCETSAHASSRQHREDCPLYVSGVRASLLAKLIPGDTER